MSRLGFQKSNGRALGGAGLALMLAGLMPATPALALDIPSMPQFQLDPGQIDDVVAYLKSLAEPAQ